MSEPQPLNITDAQTDLIDTTEHQLQVDVKCSCGRWRSWWPGIGGIAEGFADHLLREHEAAQQ